MRNLIKKILTESDEFDWIRTTNLNPWYEYDIIHFDVEPSKEDVTMYIEMAITTRNIENSSSWKPPYKSDIAAMINHYRNSGSCYLVVGKRKDLTYGNSLALWQPKEIERKSVIKYSQLIGRDTLKESNDFDWVRDINPPKIKADKSYLVNAPYLDQFLETVEHVTPKARWASTSKPTEFSPFDNVPPGSNLLPIYIQVNIHYNWMLSYRQYNIDSDILPEDGKNYIIHWPHIYT